MMKIKKNIQTISLSIFLFLSFVTITSLNIDAQETITVGPGPIYDFSKITDAITYANESDIIYVYNGTYNENVVINKSITLKGESRANTIIVSANKTKNTIEVWANNTKISGFTIRNPGSTYACVQIHYSNFCQIIDNYFENGENSVYLINSDKNEIKDNIIDNNKNGIYLWTANNNTIRNNKIQNNDIYGIFISSSSSANTIYLNDFSNNFVNNSRDDGNNSWDYNYQGNYWDDYNDYDLNNDGLGDNPYLISGSGGNKDYYSLGDFLSPTQPVAYIDSINPNPSGLGKTITFIGHGSSPSGSIELYEWKIDNNALSNYDSFSISSIGAGAHNISFRVKNNQGIWSEKDYETLVVNPNQKPVAYILSPSGLAIFGAPLNFTAYSIDPDGEIIAYSWRSIPIYIINKNASFTLDDLPVDNYTIYLKVKDNQNIWSEEVYTNLTILPNTTILNAPPVADAKGPYQGFVNQSITFDASESFDPDINDTLEYLWDFGDNSTSIGIAVNHVYKTQGNFTVTLTVTDNHGIFSKNSTIALISLEQNNQNKQNNSTPGFELILFFITILFIIILKKIN